MTLTDRVGPLQEALSSYLRNQTLSPTSASPTMDLPGNTGSKSTASDRVELMCYCYFMPAVCIIGIVGNSANLMTLASPRLRAVTYMYLRGMAVADIITLLAVLPFVYYRISELILLKDVQLTSPHLIYSQPWAIFISSILLITINWPMTTTTILVVALTAERYLSVCWPLQFRQWNSPRRAIVTIAAAYLVPMVPYCVKYWEGSVRNRTVNVTGNWTETDGSLSEYQVTFVEYRPGYSSLRNTKAFKGMDLGREILFKGLPILTIALLNILIIIAFRRHQELRKRLRNRGSGSSTQRDNRSLLFLLAGIVVLFFVCKTPAAINNIFIDDKRKKMHGYKIFRAVANVLEVANHALNFYVFCLCSGDYRSIFLEKFPCIQKTIRKSQKFSNYMRTRFSKSAASPKSHTLVEESVHEVSEHNLSGAHDSKPRDSEKSEEGKEVGENEALIIPTPQTTKKPSRVVMDMSTSGVYEADPLGEEKNGILLVAENEEEEVFL